ALGLPLFVSLRFRHSILSLAALGVASALVAVSFVRNSDAATPVGKDAPLALSAVAEPSKALIDDVNQRLEQGWNDNGVVPSEVADDHEWLRRVYLDVVGHIPPADEVEKFVADKDRAKRSQLVDRLLEDPDYVRNWTTIWTNLSIGRGKPQ